MNYTKLNSTLKVISEGELPRDMWGHVLSGEEMIVWYGFDEILDADELKYIERRLTELAETQIIKDIMNLLQI